MAPSQARPNYTATASTPSTTTMASAAAPKPKPSGGASTFDDLWNTSLSTVSSAPSGSGVQGKQSLNEMGQQKTVDKLWGMGASGGSGSGQNGGAAAKQGGAGDFDDLLL